MPQRERGRGQRPPATPHPKGGDTSSPAGHQGSPAGETQRVRRALCMRGLKEVQQKISWEHHSACSQLIGIYFYLRFSYERSITWQGWLEIQ